MRVARGAPRGRQINKIDYLHSLGRGVARGHGQSHIYGQRTGAAPGTKMQASPNLFGKGFVGNRVGNKIIEDYGVDRMEDAGVFRGLRDDKDLLDRRQRQMDLKLQPQRPFRPGEPGGPVDVAPFHPDNPEQRPPIQHWLGKRQGPLGLDPLGGGKVWQNLGPPIGLPKPPQKPPPGMQAPPDLPPIPGPEFENDPLPGDTVKDMPFPGLGREPVALSGRPIIPAPFGPLNGQYS